MARRKTIAKTWKDKHYLTQIPFTYIISQKTPKPLQNPTSRLPSVKQNENFEEFQNPKSHLLRPSLSKPKILKFVDSSPAPQNRRPVREGLGKRSRDFYIVLDDVAVMHLSFGPEFSKAVEAKQGVQQVVKRSKFVVAKADRARKTAAVIRAEAARLISEATKGATMIKADGLRRIEAWREITAMLAKNLNVSYLPGDEGNGILWGLVVGESVMRMKRLPLVL